MKRERFLEIMDSESSLSKMGEEGCNVMKGLKIIETYIPGSGIVRAENGIIWAVDIDELIDAGINEEDSIELREQNWMIEREYMACFV